MASRTRLLVMIALASVAGATGWARAQDTTQQQPAGTTPGTQTPTATPPVQPEQPAQEPAVVPPPAPAAPVPTPVPAPSVGVEEVQANPADAAAAPVKRGKQQFGEEIVVTGSRIRRKDLTTPAPVTVLSREQVQASGRVSIGDFLQSLPEQGNAINTAVNNGGDGATRINLRNLGTARTLVLINGRRMVPGGTGADDSVDLNSIPVSAIERIEILKDGASAVYGSDAIAGVVNIITRRKFQGAEISVYGGTSQHGDGQTYDVNGTIGTSNEKGGVMFSAGFFKQEKVMAGDRDFSKIARGFDATGQNNPQGNPPGEYSYGNSGTVPAGSFSIPASAAGKVVPLTGDPEQDAKIALYNVDRHRLADEDEVRPRPRRAERLAPLRLAGRPAPGRRVQHAARELPHHAAAAHLAVLGR